MGVLGHFGHVFDLNVFCVFRRVSGVFSLAAFFGTNYESCFNALSWRMRRFGEMDLDTYCSSAETTRPIDLKFWDIRVTDPCHNILKLQVPILPGKG